MNIPLRYDRRKTSTTMVGTLAIGSDYPVRIQTMANTSTDDIDASVSQALRCRQTGADLFRFTTQGIKEVEALQQIHSQLSALRSSLPLVADIHFRSDVAEAAAQVVEKVRINPGNYANDPEAARARFIRLLAICREHNTALRIGVNHGSLSRRIMDRYGDTPEGMVESCMEFLRIAVEQDFHNIVLSIKASDTHVMVTTVRMLVAAMERENMAFPLHLGVTEAGEGEDGRIKSAVGIGALLADGIGDTVRVSLSEAPEAELPVARALVDYFANPDSPRYHGNQVEIDGDTVVFRGIETDDGLFALHAAAECGRLLWDYGCTRLQLIPLNSSLSSLEGRLMCDSLHRNILQAAGLVRYKTEFVSCPGCGRTMFDLQKTVAEIKAAFAERQDGPYYKIAVMGCIVNGPGEMADADFGYVGAGRGRVSLYRKKECVLKNIPQEEAVARLLELISSSE